MPDRVEPPPASGPVPRRGFLKTTGALAAPPPALVAVGQPNQLRCVREADWKYARCFDPAGVKAEQSGMDDLMNDPDEVTNLAASTTPAVVAEKNRLAQKLADLEAARLRPFSALRLPQILR